MNDPLQETLVAPGEVVREGGSSSALNALNVSEGVVYVDQKRKRTGDADNGSVGRSGGIALLWNGGVDVRADSEQAEENGVATRAAQPVVHQVRQQARDLSRNFGEWMLVARRERKVSRRGGLQTPGPPPTGRYQHQTSNLRNKGLHSNFRFAVLEELNDKGEEGLDNCLQMMEFQKDGVSVLSLYLYTQNPLFNPKLPTTVSSSRRNLLSLAPVVSKSRSCYTTNIMSNPFSITSTTERRELFRRIINVDSPLLPTDEDRVLASIMENPELLESLTDKKSRQLRALARNVTAEPWQIPLAISNNEPVPAVSQFMPSAQTSMVRSLPISVEGTSSVPTARKLDMLIILPEMFPTSLSSELLFAPSTPKSGLSIPIPSGDPYDPATHNLPSFMHVNVSHLPGLVTLSDFVNFVTSNLVIRNVAQFAKMHLVPSSGPDISIPVSVPMSSVKSKHAHDPVSRTQESVPSIPVLLAHSSQKGKEKMSFAGTSEKRKLDSLDDVVFISETKQHKKGSSSFPPRMTRSHTGSLPVAPSASAPSEIKQSYQPILLSPTLLSTSSTVPKEQTTLLARKQLAATIQTSLAHLRSSVASQQVTITGLEVILEDQTQEIARLENIRARIISACRARGPTSSSGEDDDVFLLIIHHVRAPR
nr:uncharacterized protein LOC109174067 [Ipomoea batatas]